MLKRQFLKAIGERLNTATEEEATVRRFCIMKKAHYLLPPEVREECRRILLIERGHLPPKLVAAWRKAMRQAEEEGVSPDELTPEKVTAWQKAIMQAKRELGLPNA